MKTLKLSIALLLIAISFFSCSSDNDSTTTPDNCEEAAAAALTASNAYTNATDENREALCNAYKAALNNQIDLCGDGSGALQDIIDDLGDCTLGNNSSMISVVIGTLPKTFETNLTITTVAIQLK
jgi:hypothetical protein